MKELKDRVFRPYLLAKGGIAGGDQHGAYFQSHQGEYHQLTGRWASIEAQFFVTELENGTWLAGRCAYNDEPTYPDRDTAIKAAADKVIQRVRSLTLASGPLRMYHEQANAIIRWAASIADMPAPPRVEPPAPPIKKGQLDLFS